MVLLKTNNFIVLVVFLICTQACLGQQLASDFIYQKVEDGKSFFENSNKKYVNAVKYLPTSYVKDASVDYPAQLQKAVNENDNVSLPNFPVLINDSGLKLKSNSNIFFNNKSRLIMKPSSKSKYSLLYIEDVSNVNIYNPYLIGDRGKRIGSKGEWGMGISIYGSTNIKVYNLNIRDTWGDGIYISSYKKIPSENVLIRNGSIDNVRRNGISIITGKNLLIDNIIISNTNGIRPGAGLDIEPNYRTDVLENITIKDVFTFNNENEGILLVLTRIGKPDFNKKITLNINNHKDIGSAYAMRFGSGFRKNDKPLVGEIKIENSRWEKIRNPGIIKVTGNLNNLPLVYFDNIKVKDVKAHNINFKEHLNKIKRNNKQFKIVETSK